MHTNVTVRSPVNDVVPPLNLQFTKPTVSNNMTQQYNAMMYADIGKKKQKVQSPVNQYKQQFFAQNSDRKYHTN